VPRTQFAAFVTLVQGRYRPRCGVQAASAVPEEVTVDRAELNRDGPLLRQLGLRPGHA
jgi:hypothetical protein